MKIKILFIFLFFTNIGCKKDFFGRDPKNTPENNFEVFWNDFNKNYAQFNIRHINWDSVYSIYRPQINSNTSDIQLYHVLSNMVYLINDMHVSLYTPYRNVFWNGTAKLIGSYPSSKLVNICKYLNCNNNQNSAIYQYRDLQGYNVGYILIKNFEGEGNGLNLADSKYNFIDDILEQFKNKDGLIIDVRSNQGGNMYNPPTVASRFADMKRTYFKFCLKNGPSKNDFSDWMYQYIEPSGKFQYKKPIIVITSRATSSAAELFVLAMKSFPYVITVGDTTGGGFGLPIFRELPNGWSYRLSTAIGATQDNLIIEGRGIPPDFPVITAISDSINGVDQLMEKSIEVITTKISK